MAEKSAMVDSWINKIATERVVGEIKPEILRSVLEEYGANFEPSPELETLVEYSNKAKAPGVKKVWGEERYEAYKNWAIDVCVPKYERDYHKELPNLFNRKTGKYDKNVKYSGMLAFLGELTAYAAGKMSPEDYKRLTENRVRKGQEWIDRKPGEVYEPSPNAAYLPEFAVDAWSYLKSTK